MVALLAYIYLLRETLIDCISLNVSVTAKPKQKQTCVKLSGFKDEKKKIFLFLA
jgi:hypothetical protein